MTHLAQARVAVTALKIATVSIVLTACHQATPTDVGAATTRAAMPMATMQAGARAQAVSPTTVPPSAGGAALKQPSGPL